MDALNSGSFRAVSGKSGARTMLTQYSEAAPLAIRRPETVNGLYTKKPLSAWARTAHYGISLHAPGPAFCRPPEIPDWCLGMDYVDDL